VTFNGTAESCAKYLSRGRRVYVEGRLRTGTYTNRDGEEKTTTELLAASVIFLDAPRQEGGQKPEERPSLRKPRPAESGARGGSADIQDEDIPF
jgi:single-strand DNA-binding protein